MKATGIVRRIDDLGRVVIPKELRRVYAINEGDPLEIFTDDNGITFRKYNPGCVICGAVESDSLDVDGITLCMKHAMAIKEMYEKTASSAPTPKTATERS